MKKLILLAGIFTAFACAGFFPSAAQAQEHGENLPPGRALKLVLARQSTVPIVDIMKDVSQKCPNVTITTNPQRSDYMLFAGGWSGEYRFMVIGKGGDTLYATKTALLSNAVKDVCHFLNTRP